MRLGTPSRTPLRAYITQSLLLLAALVLVFPGTFLRGEMIGPGDILYQIEPWKPYAPEGFEGPKNWLMSDVVTAFFPYYALTTAALEEGAWPLWNDKEFGGMPLLANCQTAIFYPPRLLHAFLELRLATTIYIVLKLWLCGMAAFLCARGLGLALPYARFFSFAWMLASYNLIWCNWSLPDVGVWLPVLFLGVEQVLGGRQLRGFCAMTIGGTLILLAGHPETAFGMCLGLGVYYAARLALEARSVRAVVAPSLVCAAAWGLALLICAPQLLPFAEYLLNSSTFFDRPHQNIMTWINPAGVAGLWVPRFFGTSSEGNFYGAINSNFYGMIYTGIGVWLSAALLIAVRKSLGTRKPLVIGLLISAAWGFAMGFRVPPFEAVQQLPVLNSMIHGYHIAFAVFALPLLGAIGLEQWFSAPRRVRDLWPAAAVVALAAGMLWAVYAFMGTFLTAAKVDGYVHLQLWTAAIFAATGLGLLALSVRLRRPAVMVGLLTMVLAADLLWSNRGLNPTMPREQIFPETQLTKYLQALPQPVRVGIAEGGVNSGLFAPYGIEEWLAYDGLYPARMRRYQSTLGPNVWEKMEPLHAIEYYLYNPKFEADWPLQELGRFQLETALDGLDVYLNLHAMPRAFLVDGVERHADGQAVLDRLLQPDYEPMRAVAVESALLPGGVEERLAQAKEESPELLHIARVVAHESTRVRIKVDAERESVLVLADAYYPGWEARVDGKPVEHFPAYFAFRGLVVPAGQHEVEYVYNPWSFRLGLWISVAALTVGAVGVLFAKKRAQMA
jgi:hypothetical protein